MWARGRGIRFEGPSASSSSAGTSSLSSVPAPMSLDSAPVRMSKAERLAAAVETRRKEQQYFSQYTNSSIGRGYYSSQPSAVPRALPNAASVGQQTKTRPTSEEAYFNDDDDDGGNQLEYTPAPDSPTGKATVNAADDEEDPLDSFMASVEVQAKIDKGWRPSLRGDSFSRRRAAFYQMQIRLRKRKRTVLLSRRRKAFLINRNLVGLISKMKTCRSHTLSVFILAGQYRHFVY